MGELWDPSRCWPIKKYRRPLRAASPSLLMLIGRRHYFSPIQVGYSHRNGPIWAFVIDLIKMMMFLVQTSDASVEFFVI